MNLGNVQRKQGYTYKAPDWPKKILKNEEMEASAENYKDLREECGLLGGDSIYASKTNLLPILGLGAQRPIPFLKTLDQAKTKVKYTITLVWEMWRSHKYLCDSDARSGLRPTSSQFNLDSGFNGQSSEIKYVIVKHKPIGDEYVSEEEFVKSLTGKAIFEGFSEEAKVTPLKLITNALEFRDHRVDTGLNYQKAMQLGNKDIDSTWAEIYFRKNLVILSRLNNKLGAHEVNLQIMTPNEAGLAAWMRKGYKDK